MLTKRSKNAIIRGILTKNSPIYVQFALSKGCNLRCKMCGATKSRSNENELNLDEIRQLSDVFDKLGVGVVVLTGGEPSLRKDLSEVIKIFSEKGFDVKLQTNGTLITEDKVKEFVKNGLKDVTISLDTLDEEKQDEINGVKGSWKKVINSLALFSEILPKKGNMSIINTVVSRWNMEDVPNIIKFVTRIGFYNSLIPVHIGQGDKFIVRKDSQEFRFREEDFNKLDTLYDNIIKMKKQGYHVHNTYKFLRECPDFLKYGKISWKCDSPYLYFSVSPGGLFLPCVDLKGEKSMLDKDFIEVFNSKEFKRRILQKVRSCPGCMYACYPEVSYFVKNPLVLLERSLQERKIAKFIRKPYNYEEMLEIIKEIKK